MRVLGAALASVLGLAGFGFVGASAVGALGLAVGAPVSGSVIVADLSSSTVTEVAPNGSQQLAGTSVSSPYDVAVDGSGNVYIANVYSSSIEEYTIFGGDEQLGSNLSEPSGVAVDTSGNVYVADYGSDNVIEINGATGAQSVIAQGFAPWGIAVDAAGNVFVSDQSDNEIIEIPANGSGQEVVASNVVSPYGISVDSQDDIYVAEYGSDQVIEIPAGTETQNLVASDVAAVNLSVAANGDLIVPDANSGNVYSYPAGGGNPTVIASGFAYPVAAVTYPPAVGSFPLTVQVSATGTYGGAYTLSASYSGFVDGDTSSVIGGTLNCSSLYTIEDAATPVGSWPLLSCSGLTAPSRYQIDYQLGSVTIGPAPLTISPGTTQMTYGTVPTITPVYSGLVGGDTAASLATPPACTTTALVTSNAGTSFPTTCSGAVDPNYTISYTSGTIKVVPALLTVEAPAAVMTYGGTLPTLSPTYVGLMNGQSASVLTSQATCSTLARSSSPASSYPVTCNGAAGANYAPTYVAGTLTIAPAPLTVVAPTLTLVLGSTLPTLSPTYSGFVNSDTAASLTTPATCTTSALNALLTGTFSTSCSGAVDPNYTISYTPGTLQVTNQVLTITASSAAMAYGSTPAAITPSYSGFVNGQTASILTTLPTCKTTATSTSAVGTYTSSCSGAVAPGYTVIYDAGTVTVDPAPLSITASSSSVPYGTAATVTPQYSGLVAGNTASSLTKAPTCTTTETATSNAGTSFPSSCSGAVDSNYTISYMAGAVAVTKAPLTVTASSDTEAYGTSPAAITPIYTGLVNNQSARSVLSSAPSCSTSVRATTTPGTYASACSGAAATNYSVSYVPGVVTVTQAPLTITASSESVATGSTPGAITASYSGFVNGNTASSLTTLPRCSTTATKSSAAGTYPSTCSGAADPNYAITYVAGSVRVGSMTITVTPNNVTKIFGQAVPAFTFTYSGLPAGMSLASAGITGAPSCTTPAAAYSPAGSYPITCTAGTLAGVGDTFVTHSATLTVSFSGACVSFLDWGNLTVGPGQATCVTPGTLILGSVNVAPGGSIDIESSYVLGSVGSIGANVDRVCSSDIGGSVTVSNSTGLVTIGDANRSCGGNTVLGNVTATNNHGGVEISGDTVYGSVNRSGNSGTLPSPESGSVYVASNHGGYSFLSSFGW